MNKNTNTNTKTKIRSKIPALVAFFSVLMAAATQVCADAIVRTSGKRIEGVQITKATYDQVLYKKGGNTSQISGDSVASIERDSAVIGRIRSALDSGDYSAALKAAKRAESGVQGWEAAEVAYLFGRIYLEAGRPPQADEAFAKYLSAHQEGKDYWVPHALYGRGRAAIEGRKGGTAMQYFDQLAQFGETWDLRATLGKAQGAVLKKSYVEARTLFQKVARDRKAPDSLKAQATVGRIEVLVLQEQYSAAATDLQSTFFDSPDKALASYGDARAKATYLMGVSLQKQGGKENLEQAEIWFLRTAVLYKGHPAIYKDACKDLAALYGQLGRANRATEWKSRAGS